MEKTLYQKLTEGVLDDVHIRALIDWQMSLRAEEIDCSLLDECLRCLYPDAPDMDRQRMDARLEPFRRSVMPVRRSTNSRVIRAHRRPKKAVAVALLAILLVALAVSAVAYMFTRGVLNFNADWGWGTRITSQPGAEELVVSGTLAHVELEHVSIDVLEAVCDGAELRVVYGVTSKVGAPYLPPNDDTIYTVPGAQEDHVHMCDSILVNGEDAYFYDTYETLGEDPNQVLYYLQTNLLEWDVDVTQAETIAVGLPMIGGGDVPRQMVEFTIPAMISEEMIRGATLIEASANGRSVALTDARFTPLGGRVEFFVEGATQETLWHDAHGMGHAYDTDGTRIPSSRLEIFKMKEGGAAVGFYMMPPDAGWPEEIRFVNLMEAEEDWTFSIALNAE